MHLVCITFHVIDPCFQTTGAEAIIDAVMTNGQVFVRNSVPSNGKLSGSLVLNNVRLNNVRLPSVSLVELSSSLVALRLSHLGVKAMPTLAPTLPAVSPKAIFLGSTSLPCCLMDKAKSLERLILNMLPTLPANSSASRPRVARVTEGPMIPLASGTLLTRYANASMSDLCAC